MKKTVSLILALILFAAMLSGCGEIKPLIGLDKQNPSNGNTPPQNDGGNMPEDSGSEALPSGSDTESQPEPADFSATDEDMFSSRDGKDSYDENTAIKIELRGDTAAAGSKSVVTDGGVVTLTEEATYLITGSLTDGQLIVNAPENAKLQLVFDGVDIVSSSSAALFIKEGDKVFITLKGENTLENGGEFASSEDNIDGALFSKQDLTINGSGSLSVISPAGHGIVCKDDLVLYGGSLSISSASHAIDANDSVRIKNTALTLASGKDGIHCENSENSEKGFVYVSSGSFDITAEGDGVDAGAYLQICDGSFDITAGGGYENGDKQQSDSWGQGGGGFFPGGGNRPGGFGGTGNKPRNQGYTVLETASGTGDTGTSMKGLKANTGLLISSGTFNINSADDGVHSDMSVIINGGVLHIASGDDGIHGEESLTVTAGNIDITNSYEGMEALNINVKGGDIKLKATDDGLNAAGGTDGSGFGGRDDMFGGFGGFGGKPGGGMGGSSNGSITVSGGNVNITASGDGLDANGTLEITGGYVTVTGPTQGDTAVLDYDKTGVISGGTFIGTGSSMMAQSLSSGTQGVIAVSVGSQNAGTKITLTDKNGKEILSRTPELSFQIAIISSPEIISGETYTLTVGSQSASVTAK